MQAKIELKNVSYVYSEGTPFRSDALSDVNLKFEESVITGVIGHTGSGKSTLVQLLNGLLKPTSGSVLLDGKDIWDKSTDIKSVRFRVGLVFQYPEYQLFEETVAKDIAFGPKNMGLGEEEIKNRIYEAVRFVGLGEENLEKSPFELSGGQKRRAAIAGVMSMDPEVLILDEPAAGLDPKGREDILGGIWAYQRQKKNTVIIISHSMEDMARYADRLVVMKSGSVMMTGSCSEVFSHTDELEKAGLGVLQITSFMKKLRERGIDVRTDIFTVDDAREEILRFRREKRGTGQPNA